MTLTPSERRTLVLMSNYAIEWEASAADSVVGLDDYKRRKRDADSTIKRIEALRDKLLGRKAT